MNLLRSQAFYIICGIAAVGGVALGVTGLRAMPGVLTEMERAGNLYRELESLTRDPVNQDAIDAERERIEETLADYEKVFVKAGELYQYEPLTPDTFPNGGESSRREFQREYVEAMERLFDSLHAGQPATAIQIDEMEAKIADELASQSTATADVAGPKRTASGVLTRSGARLDARARAHMAAAQRIYCYATPFTTAEKDAGRGRSRTAAKKIPSLDYDPVMMDLAAVDAPTSEDVWRAQVAYWIQKDVVDAIAAVNEERAAEARARKEEIWVGIMPVKDVISIRVAIDYVLPDGDRYDGAEPGGYDEALPPNSVVTAFTQTASNELFDVRQSTVKLIMDQRDIPRLLNRLTSGTFHTPLRVAYRTVPPNKDMRGKIYGTGAVVNVVIDFETVMLGDVFRPLMPPSVCAQLAEEGYGIECPEITEEEG